MICTFYDDGKTHTRYHKYSNPLVGRKQIYQRVNGKWEKWCRPDQKYSKPCELTVSDKGAVLSSYFNEKITNEDFSKKHGIPMGTPFIQRHRYYLDFEFVTRKGETTDLRMSGHSITGKPHTTWNWNCKLKDAPSPSIKGRIEGVIR